MLRIYIISFIITTLLIGCENQTERMANYEVHGIDVSHHQVTIDWEKIANQNIDFAFIKATEGGDHLDSMFCKNWAAIYDHNIIRGAYHFYRPDIDPVVQIENFKNQVEMAEGDMPPVLDVEISGELSRIELMQSVQKCLTLLETHYHTMPILYTNNKFYNKYFNDYFSEYPLWIARYNSEQPLLVDKTKWTFWQYGNKGSLDGISGEVDLNVFHGDSTQLNQLLYRHPVFVSMR